MSSYYSYNTNFSFIFNNKQRLNQYHKPTTQKIRSKCCALIMSSRHYINAPIPKYNRPVPSKPESLAFDVVEVTPWSPHPKPLSALYPIDPPPGVTFTYFDLSDNSADDSTQDAKSDTSSCPDLVSVSSSEDKISNPKDFLPFGSASTYDTKEERESRTIRFCKYDGMEDYVVLALEDEPWLL